MENEIKVGEYCRTSAGKIFKCSKIVLGNILKDENKTMIVNYIVKHSPNLIDLIQCGDYVNGMLVVNIVQFLDEINSCFKQILVNRDKDCTLPPLRISEEQIKTIVTKEMMESITYKVTKM